jgi:xanthosine utilization system XapX-like protein
VASEERVDRRSNFLILGLAMSNMKELIDEVRGVIGVGSADTDWKVIPTQHAEQFKPKAPTLAENLLAARPSGLAEEFEKLDSDAVKARDRFKKVVGRADYAVFFTASLAALLLVGAGIQDLLGEPGPRVVAGIGLLGVIAGGLAAMWLRQVKDGELARKWSCQRAKAEAKRLAYFKAVMMGAAQSPRDQLLALEYTRRFLLDNQIDYFRDRGSQHERAAATTLTRASWSVFFASTLTAIAGMLAVWKPQLALIAGVGVMASAFATLVNSRTSVNLDRKNADQYRNTGDTLGERKLDIDTYRERAADGDKQAVQEFFEPIFVALAADHRLFLDNLEKREMAIGAMEKRLDAATEALPRKHDGQARSGTRN